MLLSLRKNGLSSLFKEVRGFQGGCFLWLLGMVRGVPGGPNIFWLPDVDSSILIWMSSFLSISDRKAKGARGKGPRPKTPKFVKKCQDKFQRFLTNFAFAKTVNGEIVL